MKDPRGHGAQLAHCAVLCVEVPVHLLDSTMYCPALQIGQLLHALSVALAADPSLQPPSEMNCPTWHGWQGWQSLELGDAVVPLHRFRMYCPAAQVRLHGRHCTVSEAELPVHGLLMYEPGEQDDLQGEHLCVSLLMMLPPGHWVEMYSPGAHAPHLLQFTFW